MFWLEYDLAVRSSELEALRLERSVDNTNKPIKGSEYEFIYY